MKLVSLCCKNAPLAAVVMLKMQMKMSKTIEIGWSAPTCDNIDGPENFIK